jgi:hypothetical protein
MTVDVEVARTGLSPCTFMVQRHFERARSCHFIVGGSSGKICVHSMVPILVIDYGGKELEWNRRQQLTTKSLSVTAAR